MTASLVLSVPIVTVIDKGRRIRVNRPTKGHTFDFPVGRENDAEMLAACLRGALADAFNAGQVAP